VALAPGPGVCLARNYAEQGGGRARLAAACHPELAQDRRDVVVDCLRRDDQPLCDLRVAEPLREQRQHLELAVRQPGRILAGRCPRPPREVALAELAQSLCDDRRRRVRPERAKLLVGGAQQ